MLQVALRSAVVLWRAGLVPFPRVDDGVRSLIAARKYGPFAGVVELGARRDSSGIALIDELGALTFDELNQRVNALARAWTRRGIRSGMVLGALCRDHRGLVTVMAAAGKVGATLLLMNTGFAKPQLVDVVVRENVGALVYDEEFTELVDAMGPEVQRYLAWRDTGSAAGATVTEIEDLIANADGRPVPTPEKPGGFILLTSGTTGTPKGAPRGDSSPLASAQLLDRVPLRAGESTFVAAPMFHGTGLSQTALSFALGCKVVVRRSFDPEETLRGIAEHRCTTLVVVPTMLQRIVDLNPDVLRKYDTSSLRIIFAAGSAIPPDTVIRTLRTFGPVLYNLYGSTEVALATVATPDELRKTPTTAGRPPVGCTVKLFDAAGKEITHPNRTGRIFVRSGLSFQGYTDGKNKEVIAGLLATGDVGHFDEDGLLFVDGREDEMIVSGGENVYPLEIENLLSKHPDVSDAAVVGVADEEFGQRLKAFVVPAAGAKVDADGVRRYVKSNLARFKTPRDVVFVEKLPRNASGKLLRNQLS